MTDARHAPVETWKRIAAQVGRSERWCRDAAARPRDPLPVFKVGGTVRLLIADFDAWLERQRAARLTRVPAADARVIEEHW